MTQRPRNNRTTTTAIVAKADEATEAKVEATVEALVEKAVQEVPVFDLSADEARILSGLVADLYKSKAKGIADAKRDKTGRVSALMALKSLKERLDKFVSASSDDETFALPETI
jgi:hypothetical protein